MRLALYQPDIPQNAGTMFRMAVCFGLAVDVIEPCGFVLTDKHLKRAGMDYLDHLDLTRHANFATFRESVPGRLILLTTRANGAHTAVDYRPDDILMVGRESAGVPDEIHDATDAQVRIPMVAGIRSLNVAVSAAIVMGEALRQTEGFPA